MLRPLLLPLLGSCLVGCIRAFLLSPSSHPQSCRAGTLVGQSPSEQMAVVPDALRSHWPDQQSWPPSYRGYPAAGLDGPDPGPSDFDAEILHLSRQITGSYPQLSGAAAAGPASAAAHFSSKLGKPAPPEKHSRSSHYSPWLFKSTACSSPRSAETRSRA